THAWLSMPGAGIRTHFDASGAFILQLAGTKRWRISRVPVMRAPRFLAVQGPAGEIEYGEVDAAPSDYDAQRVTDAELVDVDLGPGDVLYLPAATWHGTEIISKEPSLGLSLRFIDQGFSQLAATWIEEHFLARPEWRQMPPALRDAPGAMPAHV